MILVLALSVFVGLAVGLLGGGGSILTVPILVYVAHLEAKQAIATSLLVVGVTSLVAMVSHARAGRVRFRTGVLFGAAGMAGAFLGGHVGARLPAGLLLLAFAGVMIAASFAMIRGRREGSAAPAAELPVPKVLRDGFAVGLLTGTVGAGGGFLVVPALALLGGMPMPAAIGTSVLVIAMNSFAGLLGYLGQVPIAWGLAGSVTGAAVAGSFLGSALAGRVPQEGLRKGFGYFVLAMAAFILVKQWPTLHAFLQGS
jgi:uncharacterized membrane protein YfcA